MSEKGNLFQTACYIGFVSLAVSRGESGARSPYRNERTVLFEARGHTCRASRPLARPVYRQPPRTTQSFSKLAGGDRCVGQKGRGRALYRKGGFAGAVPAVQRRIFEFVGRKSSKERSSDKAVAHRARTPTLARTRTSSSQRSRTVRSRRVARRAPPRSHAPAPRARNALGP